MKIKTTSILIILACSIDPTSGYASTAWTSLIGPFGYSNPQIFKPHQGAIQTL